MGGGGEEGRKSPKNKQWANGGSLAREGKGPQIYLVDRGLRRGTVVNSLDPGKHRALSLREGNGTQRRTLDCFSGGSRSSQQK